MMKLKRSLALITLLVLMLTLALTGCASTAAPTEPPASASTPQPEATATPDEATSQPTQEPEAAYTLPLSTTGEELVIAGPENSGDRTYSTGLPVFEEIQEKTGVKIKFETTIGTDYNTAMQTRLAAGIDLPDILALPGGDPVKYGNDGVIIDLKELIEKHAPNITAWFDKEPVARKFMTTPEGNIYTLPNELIENNGAANDSLMPPAHAIRGDWIKKLNLKTPTTIDELEQVLTAFRDQDPNGNGEKDEIPYSFPGGWNIIRFLGWSYGLHLGFNGGWYADESGKVSYDIIKPEFKELLTLANRWYAEKLLDQGFTPPNWDKWNSQITSSMVGRVPISTIYPDAVWNGTIRENEKNPEAGLVPLYPVAGPDGTCISEASFASCNSARFSLSKDCENPELAIKFIDYTCYSEQGVLWNEFGVEGVTYDMVNGEPTYKDEILNSPDGFTNEIWRAGGFHYILPQVLTAQGRYFAFVQYESVFDISAKIYNEVTVKTPLFLTGMSTVAEAEEIASINSDLSTYVNEMIDKFILGDVPVSEFDSFVETIKGMNIDRLTEIKQTQYDRFNAN